MKLTNRSTALAATVALAAAVFGVAPMCAAEDAHMVTINLSEAGQPAKAAASLAKLEGHVEVVKTQATLADGLRFDVVLTNRGDGVIRFLDPQDTTHAMLLDAEGWPIDVPKRAPSSLVNSRTRGKDPDVIALSPGQSHRVAVRITQVLPRASGDGSPRTPIAIPAGAYDVRVTVTVIAPEAPADGVRPSRTLQSEQFTVHLGV
ncbi:MAG TPA: hypothetical protein VE974_15870 [Thermoanaerobaculia bacterium]|nr:hypothetical protein [Thermoanaerobaculia bacterium]